MEKNMFPSLLQYFLVKGRLTSYWSVW